jgi:DNA-directed RNA polymerase specialized sigma24 family protein
MTEKKRSKAVRDGHGSLDRQPAVPKRGIGEQLRRAHCTYLRQCERITRWERRASDLRSVLDSGVVKGRGQLERDLASIEHSIDRTKTARGLTKRRIEVCVESLKARTLQNKRAKRVLGSKGVKQILADISRTDDVCDAAKVKARGSEANSAMERIVERTAPIANRLIGSCTHYSESEKRTRVATGIYRATMTWEPHHPLRRKLSSHIHQRAQRELQARTKAEKPLPGTSLDALRTGKEDDGRNTPVGVSATQAKGVAPSANGLARATQSREGLTMDVAEALSRLREPDQTIIRRCTMDGESQRQVARDLGLTQAQLRGRLARAQSVLREILREYEGG